jgi:hypothetical protein
MTEDIALPPVPTAPSEAVRWDHSRLRRRMLTGAWLPDLVSRLVLEVGTVRQDAWGVPKITANPFAVICRELSALYANTPEVRAAKGDIIYGPLADAIDASGLWAKMPRFQSNVIGVREYLWRLTATADGHIQYRPVAPDFVVAESSCDDPSRPILIKELRYRAGIGWCWDVLDISDPAYPVYRVETASKGVNVSEAVLGGSYSGEAYPYRKQDGTPVLPYVLYSADSLGDCLWHWQDGIETVEACLDLAVNYTFLGHVLRDASFPQRYAVGVRVAGLGVAGPDSGNVRQEIVTDPATLLMLEQMDGGGTVLVSQWQPGGDVEKMDGVISSLANRIAIEAGLPPSDIQRLGGTARSGYAISLTNEGKRVAARRYAPVFRKSDEELISLTAVLLNRATGSNILESGYRVIYRDLPLSPDELRERRTNIVELMGAGLLSPVDAYAELHPGMTREQAQADLLRIRQERALFSSPTGI